MPDKKYYIRGRHIGDDDLDMIRAVIADHWDKGRSAISRILCQKWDWRQANGLLKERGCRVLLLTLEKKEEIKLPPRMWESFAYSTQSGQSVHGMMDSVPH